MAKRFEFRLDTLLKVRRIREREAKRKVAAQHAVIAQLDWLDEQTTAEISRQQDALLTGQQAGRLDPVELQRGRGWIAHLRRTVSLRHAQREHLQEELLHLQAVLREARTQTRVIEKLRERRWDDYRRVRDRTEQAAADELAQQLHSYQSM